ncbi:MAG: radical SAM protein [Lachnospiraceae bacterium]|nr:radical SAM protein [Lachnospiraceae bacterium]MBD5525661.1 radical SAM protein [Lachnospiraceae bacterium]
MDKLSINPCNLCPRECNVRREEGQMGYCRSDDRIFIARAALHMWEEPCISGEKGSGTVFFSGCNLRCVYCQNYEIAAGGRGKAVSVERLAQIFLTLQEQGAANINLVTPDHYVPGVAQAVLKAKKQGLVLPVVYNCSGYAKREVIKSLAGIVDIFLTDFKYMDPALAAKYSAALDYPAVAKEALEEMVYITYKDGDENLPLFDETGMMQRGVIVRHLLLPGHKQNAKDVIRYVYETYGDSVYISLMNQYTPFDRLRDRPEYGELGRKVTKREYESVVDYAIDLGITNAYIQEGDTARESFIPPFDVRKE